MAKVMCMSYKEVVGADKQPPCPSKEHVLERRTDVWHVWLASPRMQLHMHTIDAVLRHRLHVVVACRAHARLVKLPVRCPQCIHALALLLPLSLGSSLPCP